MRFTTSRTTYQILVGNFFLTERAFRLRRCFAAGAGQHMSWPWLTSAFSAAAVRYGRVPKRSRERAESLESTGSADGLSEAPVEVDPAVEQQQLLDMIAGVTAAHRAHCNYTEEATRDTVRRPAGQAIAQARARVSTRARAPWPLAL